MTEKEIKNATKIGTDGMLFQTIEECGELIKAISKYNRTRGIGQSTPTTKDEAMKNLVEEIADVEICIRHVKYLLGIDTEKVQNEAIDKVYNRNSTSTINIYEQALSPFMTKS